MRFSGSSRRKYRALSSGSPKRIVKNAARRNATRAGANAAGCLVPLLLLSLLGITGVTVFRAGHARA